MTLDSAATPSSSPAAASALISIVVPALNEAQNLPELARRVDAAMAGWAYELIIVDDNSEDDTVAVAGELAKRYPLKLIVRTQPQDGLSGAVLHGFSAARGEVLVVMDADLQHPPEKLPELISAVEIGGAEFALGSRYVPGGTTAEKWSLARKINSWIATLLARPFVGPTRDPMSGFFALRRSTFERGRHLTPLGYKIGLELMCKCRVGEVREVPIHFDTRAQGDSKLTLTQQFKYLEHLSRLYDFCYPRLSPIVKFIIATAFGWLVGLGVFELLLWRNVHPGAAIPLAYLGAVASTIIFHFRYVRTQRKFLVTRTPWRDFVIVALGEFVTATLAGLYLLSRDWRMHAIELFILTFGAATLARYVLRKELMQDIRGLRRELRADETVSVRSESCETTTEQSGT